MARRRTIYIKNPSQGSNFRTIGAGDGGTKPHGPTTPHYAGGGSGGGSGDGIFHTEYIDTGAGGIVTRVIAPDGSVHYLRGTREVTAESILTPGFVTPWTTNDSSHEQRFRQYEGVTKPVLPTPPRGPVYPGGFPKPPFDWNFHVEGPFGSGDFNFGNLWSERHLIRKPDGLKNSGLVIYTDPGHGGDIPEGFYPNDTRPTHKP